MQFTLAWVGDGAPRMEVAHVELRGNDLIAAGTQLGASYELRYHLESKALSLELVGERSLQLSLGDADFFDLGWSPLFNSLPVLRDHLLEPGTACDYVMQWVEVPSLVVHRSEQRYEPIGDRIVRFRSDDFVADIRFDDDGFVVGYPGIAMRV